ncbi:MAG: ATP-binding protein [Nitrospirota bacterium]
MIEGLDYKAYPILFVDDEKLACEVFKAQFSDQFTVYAATKGMEALEIVEHHPIAVLLSDQRMPEMTGNMLLARVREARPDTVRMIITAYADIEAAIDAINTGEVYRYISKPYDEAELRAMLQQAVERYFLVKERERLTAEKIESMRKIARANRLSAVGTMAAGVAHEINNPLVAISTFLQMVPDKRKTDDQEFWKELYEIAAREVVRIKDLVHELLAFSKYTGETALALQEVGVKALVVDMIKFIEPEARKKGVTIKAALAEGMPPARWDLDRMKQVLLNLLLNALQATGRGGVITVSGEYVEENANDRFIRLSVADTGVGISAEHLEKLFTPFFTTKGREGSGLGLMTCHHIVDQHRGSIDVESQLGKGTTFQLNVPVDPRAYDRRKAERKRLKPEELVL